MTPVPELIAWLRNTAQAVEDVLNFGCCPPGSGCTACAHKRDTIGKLREAADLIQGASRPN